MATMEKQPKIKILSYQTIFEKEFEKYLVIPSDEDRELDQELVQYALFEIGPLERGQGLTLANALRRTLLHDIKGFSITSVSFKPKWSGSQTDGNNLNNEQPGVGPVHEYSTIPGVWESIFEIINNLKKIKIRREDFPFKPLEKQTIQISINEPGEVKANRIELPFPLTILNGEQPIATILSADLSLDFIFTIEVNSESALWASTNQTYPLNTALPVNAFSLPIKWANFVLKSDSLLGSKSSEIVLFEMLTDGTVMPPEAIEKAANLCINLFSFLSKEETEMDQEDKPSLQLSEQEIPQLPTDKYPIEDLELSVRAYNCLKRAQIQNITDLLTYSKEDLLQMKNFGKKSADEVIEALQNKLGIGLAL